MGAGMTYGDAVKAVWAARSGERVRGVFPPVSDEVAQALCAAWQSPGAVGRHVAAVASMGRAYVADLDAACDLAEDMDRSIGRQARVEGTDEWAVYWAIVRWAGSVLDGTNE